VEPVGGSRRRPPHFVACGGELGAGTPDVFVRGHDGQLAHRRWAGAVGCSEWRNLGGRLTSAPTVASWGPNRLDLFVRGHEGQLAHKRWTDTDDWSEWRDLGGRLTSAPTAVSRGENRIDVVARGHDGQLAHKRWSDKMGWGDWNNLGGRPHEATVSAEVRARSVSTSLCAVTMGALPTNAGARTRSGATGTILAGA